MGGGDLSTGPAITSIGENDIVDLIIAIDTSSKADARQLIGAKLSRALESLTLVEILEYIEIPTRTFSLGLLLIASRGQIFVAEKVSFISVLNKLRSEKIIKNKAYLHLLQCARTWRQSHLRQANQLLKRAGGPEGEREILIALRRVLGQLTPR